MVVLAVNKMARGDSVEVLVPSQLCLHYAQNHSRNVKICIYLYQFLISL